MKSFGIKIKINEKKLSVRDIITIINNKRTDCVGYESCNEYFIFNDDCKHNWECPEICHYYENNNNSYQKLFIFSNSEIEKVESVIDSMDEKEKFKLFHDVFFSKDPTTKYQGANVEGFSRDTKSSGRAVKR